MTVIPTAALRVPILPHTSPEATQPEGLQLPLFPHQLRALHRCLVLESQINAADDDDGQRDNKNKNELANDFNSFHHYKARGGVLADEVGTGKTATSIGLVLSDIAEDDDDDDYYEDPGDTLVVAPKHLIPQWKSEIEKFASPDYLQVVVGKTEYERTCSVPPTNNGQKRRRIVLIDVDTILNEPKLWYDWRRVFPCRGGRQIKNLPEATMKLYKEAALFSVKSAKGHCSYEGWVYVGSLHLPQRPWRRVIYDEIQDLVREGQESQTNLLQLSRTARNVWLLSATPFPHGNASVYANHQLLGFCRFRMDVEVDHELPEHHPFEQIKRKLYIKSPRHVADAAKKDVTLIRCTEYVNPLELEQKFYQLEQQQLISAASTEAAAVDTKTNLFEERFNSLRQMTVHPEANAELRQVLQQNHGGGGKKRTYQRPVSSSVQSAAQRAVWDAKRRLAELDQQFPTDAAAQKILVALKRSIDLAERVNAFRLTTPMRQSVFERGQDATSDTALRYARRQRERETIHKECNCTCSIPGFTASTCVASKNIYFRKIVRDETSMRQPTAEQEYIFGPDAFEELVQYFQQELAEDKEVACGQGVVPAIQNYVTVTRRVLEQRKVAFAGMQEERRQLKLRIDTLSSATTPKTMVKKEVGQTSTLSEGPEQLAQRHGSKPAALVQFLKSLKQEEQVIVFSYWHDTLKLVQQTLRTCGLQCSFLDQNNPKALEQFTSGQVPILLLSAQAQASGANLQCATHVVLMDPAGSSAEHGSTLEEQAIGRAARMGQTKPVMVTRFCVKGTLEEPLFAAIDKAARTKAQKANDATYVIAKSDLEQAPPDAAAIKKRREAKSDTEVLVTGSLSQAERLKRSLQQAQEAGTVIELLDSDDEDNENAVPKQENVAPSPTLQQLPRKVKIEAAESNETNIESKRSELARVQQTDNAQLIPTEVLPKYDLLSAKESTGTDLLSTSSDATETTTDTPAKRSVDFSCTGSVDDSSEQPGPTKRARNNGNESAVAIQPTLGHTATATITPHKANPSTTTTTEMSMENLLVQELLRRMDLIEYQTKFVELGHTVAWLYENSSNLMLMEELANRVGFTAGHAIRFQSFLLNEKSRLIEQVLASQKTACSAYRHSSGSVTGEI